MSSSNPSLGAWRNPVEEEAKSVKASRDGKQGLLSQVSKAPGIHRDYNSMHRAGTSLHQILCVYITTSGLVFLRFLSVQTGGSLVPPCVFSWAFLLLVCLVQIQCESFWFFLLYFLWFHFILSRRRLSFSNDLDQRGGGELRGVTGRENQVRIYSVRKESIFP